ncbi:hypothetical protein GCM10027456_14650 [Kineosporia babensis]
MGTAVTAAALVVIAGPPAQASQDGVNSGTVSSTWQTNAPVWDLAYANGAVYAAGEFTSVRPPGAAAGTQETARRYLAAFDSSSGALLPFNHTFNVRPRVLATSPDGSVLYVGGDFTQVDGQPAGRLVAFSTATGNRITAFAPQPAAAVTAITASSGTVWFGGSFGRVNNTPRQRLAAVRAADGGLLPWNPGADGVVYTLSSSADGGKVYAGGGFSTLAGAARRAVGALDGTSGAGLPFAAGSAMPPVTNGCTSVVRDSVIASGVVYFGAEGTGGGCFDGTFAASVSSGNLIWKNTCLGGTQSVEVVRGWLYKGSHAHDCARQNAYNDPDAFPQVPESSSRHLLAQRLDNGFLGPWYPNTNAGVGGLGPRTMTTDGTNLWVGGQFTSVNKRAQVGLARFAPTPDSPPARPAAPTLVSSSGTSVQMRVTVPLDLDNTDLRVRLYRDGSSTPVATSPVQHVLFWRQPVVVLTDSGLTPGSTHTYRVDVVQADENASSTLSPASVPVVVGG